MRITNKKFNERPSNIKKIKKKIFFAFEGLRTEEIYFTRLISSLNINNILPLYFYKDKNESKSNPKSIIDELVDSIDEEKELNLTYETVKNLVIEACKNNNTLPDESKIESYIAKFANFKKAQMNSPFDKDTIHEFVEYINKRLLTSNLQQTIIENDFIEIVNFYSEYRPDIDEIYVVCDRDIKSFTDEQYLKSIKICEQKKINLIVTSPCIEFWFLLHHTNCKEYDENEIFENKKESKNSETYVYKLLKEKDDRYSKVLFNAEYYMLNLDTAILNSANYTCDIIELKDKIGTMIPVLIEKLKENHKNLK